MHLILNNLFNYLFNKSVSYLFKQAAQFDTDLEKYKKEKAVQREQIKNDHDNRIQNQGPVGLQVQEPVIPKQVLFKDDNKKLDNNPNVDAQVGTFMPCLPY